MQENITRLAPPAAIVVMIALYAYGAFTAPLVPYKWESVALPLDLMIGIPVVFYVFVVRAKGMTPLSVIPVIWIGYGLSSMALGSPQAGILPYLLAVLAPVELLIAGREIRRIARVFKGAKAESDDPMVWLRSTVHAVVRKDPVSSLAATELTIWYYLLFSWRKKPLAGEDETAFTTYKESGHMNIVLGLALAFPVEMVGVHMLIMQWSAAAALAVTLLSLYMLAWLAGDARARIMRPIAVGADAVRIECGIQCSAAIPISSIASVSRNAGKEAAKGAGVVNMGTFCNADVWITASTPFAIHTPLGEKHIRTIGFSVDDPSGFISEVECRRLNLPSA